MFLFKRKNSIYYIYYFDKSDHKRKSISTKTSYKADALLFLTNFKENLKTISEKSDLIPVYYISDLQTEVIKYVSDNMSTSNTKIYKTLFKNLIEVFGNIPLNMVTFKEIERYKGIRALTVSKASVNKDLSTLKAVFNIAIRFNWISTNPVKNVNKVILSEKEFLCFTKEQTQMIINNVQNKTIRDLVTFALLTGCRLNEIVNIQWLDVNMQDKLITIRNKANFKTKTGKIRQIPISDILFQLLKTMLTNGNNDNIVNFFNPEKYIFSNGHGYKYCKFYVTKYFKSVLRSLNFAEKFHFHCLRHTFITQLINAGVNINYVKELAGHSSINTTMHYIHITTNNLRDAVNKVSIL
jgi:site-specific recombinase XerD